MNECGICGKPAGDCHLCAECMRECKRRLIWLARIGMPALRAIAYRQADVTERSERRARRAFPAAPLNVEAQQTYTDVEKDIQYLAARIGAKPVGWDAYETTRAIRPIRILLPLLAIHVEDLARMGDAPAIMRLLVKDCERIHHHIDRPDEKILVGVCPNCEKTSLQTVTAPNGQTVTRPMRTEIRAPRSQRYGACPQCHAWLDYNQVRLNYLKEASLDAIVGTATDAAKWTKANTGIPVTGMDLKNWRRRGKMPNTVEIGDGNWKWNMIDLLKCAEDRQNKHKQP